MHGYITSGFYYPVKSISVISSSCKGDNEKICAVEPHLRLKTILPLAGLDSNPGR